MPSASPILDGELLRALVAFAEHLNFTHAARSVGLSQPALFERIQRLGAEVGTLYEREGRQLRLTAIGVRVAAFAREELERSQALLAELRGEQRREEVAIAAGEGAYLYLLGPALRAFRCELPDARLRLHTRGAKDAVACVREGAAELAVAVLDLAPEGLVVEDLLRTPLCVALAEDHPLARRRRVRLGDLAGERLIVTPEGQAHRDLVGRALGEHARGSEPPLEADGWPLMIHFASLGLGVAIINQSCELPPGVVAKPLRELGEVCYRVFWRRGVALSPAASRLRELIFEQRPGKARKRASVASRLAENRR
jgi:LysR family transcriptional regulator, low CO2-responsive transcriptional regulator